MSDYRFTTTDERIRQNTAELLDIANDAIINEHLTPQQEKRIMQLLGDDAAANIDLDAKDQDQQNALTALLNFKAQEPLYAVKMLIDAGADTEAYSNDAVTPLMHAIGFRRMQELQWLIEAGANVEARDVEGEAALIWAVSNESQTAKVWLAAMLSAGASVHGKNPEGEMAGHIEVYYSSDTIRLHTGAWKHRLHEFGQGSYTPTTREDWNHLASVLEVEDLECVPSVAVRLRMLHEMRPDLDTNLGTVRQGAVRMHARAEGL